MIILYFFCLGKIIIILFVVFRKKNFFELELEINVFGNLSVLESFFISILEQCIIDIVLKKDMNIEPRNGSRIHLRKRSLFILLFEEKKQMDKPNVLILD